MKDNKIKLSQLESSLMKAADMLRGKMDASESGTKLLMLGKTHNTKVIGVELLISPNGMRNKGK